MDQQAHQPPYRAREVGWGGYRLALGREALQVFQQRQLLHQAALHHYLHSRHRKTAVHFDFEIVCGMGCDGMRARTN